MFDPFKRRSAEWRCRNWNSRHAGKVAGAFERGYWTIRVRYQAYRRHRLVWLIVHGEWPQAGLDHKEGKEAGDGIANLRSATQSQNCANSRRRSDNTSGRKGVSWDAINGKWVARIRVHGGEYKNLGRFASIDAAAKAYEIEAIALHGEFARAA